jgi:predicted RNA-binding Zn ribbon-like protein
MLPARLAPVKAGILVLLGNAYDGTMTDFGNASAMLPFKYIGGDPAIDLVNTIDWTSRGAEHERLTSYERLTRWAVEPGILSPRQTALLRSTAARNPKEAQAALGLVLRARQVLQRVFSAVAKQERPGDALEEFNRMLGHALEHMRIIPDRAQSRPRALKLGWAELDTKLDSLLWPVLWSAASLLSSDEASRIRMCDAPDCGWMYVDRSRNGFRRWCQMETCGTREKSRRRRGSGRLRTAAPAD